MRWKKKQIQSKSGDKRTRFVFAWRRTEIDGFIVWLEFYEVHELLFEPAGGNIGLWIETSRNTVY